MVFKRISPVSISSLIPSSHLLSSTGSKSGSKARENSREAVKVVHTTCVLQVQPAVQDWLHVLYNHVLYKGHATTVRLVSIAYYKHYKK